jgi:NAD-dependent DNA ligase
MTSSNTVSSLDPCPFCGQDVRLKLLVENEEWCIARVSCQAHKCGALGPWVELEDFPTVAAAREEAVRLWNTRLIAAAPRLYEALEQAVAALRSAAGPDERMNAIRDGNAALKQARNP